MKNSIKFIIVTVLSVNCLASCSIFNKIPGVFKETDDLSGAYSNDLYVSSWHPEKGLVIGDNASTGKHYWMDSPNGKLVPYEKPVEDSPVKPADDRNAVTSHSKKFTAKTEIGQRNSGCCAVLTGENRVVIYETAQPENIIVLAEGKEADWAIHGWTADNRSILFSNDSELFLINAETKEKTDIKTNKLYRNIKVFFDNSYTRFLIVGDSPDSTLNVEAFDLASNKSETILSLPFTYRMEKKETLLSPDEKILALLVSYRGDSDDSKEFNRENLLYLFDMPKYEKRGEYKLPKGEFSTAHWHPDNGEIAFGVRTKPKTAEIYSMKTSNGELSKWFIPRAQ